MEMLMQIDGGILLFIQEVIRSPLLTDFFKLVTSLGDGGRLWILLAILLLLPKKTRKVGVMVLVSMLLSHLVNNMLLKNWVARVRPYDVIAGLETLIDRPSSYSFPSGHAASSFAAAWVMFRRLPKRYGIPAVILALFISFSRLYVGVHFPSDVLFGMVSGAVMSCVAVALVEWLSGFAKRKKVMHV